MTRDPNSMLPLPQLSFYILLALAEGEAHGWALVRRINELTAGQSNPSSGSLYLAMTRLEDAALIEEGRAPAGEDTRRRYYRLTRFGRAVARAEAQRLSRLVRHARESRLLPEGK
jgi:DNA-binding PadR family transcriptional regulator